MGASGKETQEVEGLTAPAPAQPASSTQKALAQPFTQGDRVMACV